MQATQEQVCIGDGQRAALTAIVSDEGSAKGQLTGSTLDQGVPQPTRVPLGRDRFDR